MSNRRKPRKSEPLRCFECGVARPTFSGVSVDPVTHEHAPICGSCMLKIERTGLRPTPAVSAATIADKQWFLDNPGQNEYVREIADDEREELTVKTGYSEAMLATHVRVTQVAPGLRQRRAFAAGVCSTCGQFAELRVVLVVKPDEVCSAGDGLCIDCAEAMQ